MDEQEHTRRIEKVERLIKVMFKKIEDNNAKIRELARRLAANEELSVHEIMEEESTISDEEIDEFLDQMKRD